jgi:hypothetical protein
MNNQGHVDFDNNVVVHSTGMVVLLSLYLHVTTKMDLVFISSTAGNLCHCHAHVWIT